VPSPIGLVAEARSLGDEALAPYSNVRWPLVGTARED